MRDQNGEFIIGPHTHDANAAGYQQRFDDRGHPVNKTSDSADRRLRRAQNEVLKVIGVVEAEGNPVRRDPWKVMSPDEVVDMIQWENVAGICIQELEFVPIELASWWISSFRNRLMVRLTGNSHFLCLIAVRHSPLILVSRYFLQ